MPYNHYIYDIENIAMSNYKSKPALKLFVFTNKNMAKLNVEEQLKLIKKSIKENKFHIELTQANNA